jgi:hypothetical protein
MVALQNNSSQNNKLKAKTKKQICLANWPDNLMPACA